MAGSPVYASLVYGSRRKGGGGGSGPTEEWQGHQSMPLLSMAVEGRGGGRGPTEDISAI